MLRAQGAISDRKSQFAWTRCPTQPEVMDYLHDATTGLLQPIPTDNPYDILSVDYSCEDPGGNPMIVGVNDTGGTAWSTRSGSAPVEATASA